MNTEVTGSSRSQDAVFGATQPIKSIPSLAQGQAKDIPNTDDINLIGNRDFDDGFVHTDIITPFDFRTVNFGYNNNSQHDLRTSTLTFRRQTEVSNSELVGTGQEYQKTVNTKETSINAEDEFNGAGLKINTLYDLTQLRGINFALFAGLRGYFGMDSTVGVSNFNQTINESRTSYKDIYSSSDTIVDTYVFQTSGQIPNAPYSSTNSNPSGNPLIYNLPLSADREIAHSGSTRREYGSTQISSWETRNQIAIETDIDLFQLALGGEFSYDVGSNVALNLRPSLLINFLNIDMTRREALNAYYPSGTMLAIGNWQEQKSEDIVRIGAALEAGLNIKLTESWFAGITAGYEWIDEKSIDIGPNTVNVDLSGFSTSVMIGVKL
jgi:opacity protein-like surface antigen